MKAGLLPLLLLAGCIPNGTIKQAFHMEPDPLDDGWEIGPLDQSGLDPDAVESVYRDLFAEDAYTNVLSLLVVANGRLVAEAYFRDDGDRDRVAHVQSISKSITSLITGAALHDGTLPAVDAPIDTWLDRTFPPGEPRKRAMTVEHLLTMRGGIDVSNTRFGIQVLMKGKEDSIAWLLAEPLYADPGEEMIYRDTDPHLLAATLEAASGESFEDYGRAHLFDPLGIDDWRIEAAPDGTDIAAAGFWLQPRDLARIGLLVAQDGAWDGEVLIDPGYLETATSPLVVPDFEPEHYRYGYYWWVNREHGWFTAAGHGGQYVTVVPERDVVIVLTATPYAAMYDVATSLPDWAVVVEKLLGP